MRIKTNKGHHRKAGLVLMCAILTAAVGTAGERGNEPWKHQSGQDGRCTAKMSSSAGCAWQAIGGFSGLPIVKALAVFDDGSGEALYVGGDFVTVDGVTVNRIAKWDGTTWSALSGPSGTGFDHTVESLVVYNDGNGDALYAGGNFTTAGGVTVNHIARWDGSSWSALSGPAGTGADNWVGALAVYDSGSGDALYAGGDFTTAGGVTVNRIARWDGTAWSALTGPFDTGVDGSVYALTAGDSLYAGGTFSTAGGVTVNEVARWDGSAWFDLTGPFGTGIDYHWVHELEVYNDGTGDALYVGGWFTYAGGIMAYNIARWDGVDWSDLSGPSGNGTLDGVDALEVYNDGDGDALYVGGWFTVAGGITVNRIAKWNGTLFSDLSGPAGTGIEGLGVLALAVYDDGSGDALFKKVPGTPFRHSLIECCASRRICRGRTASLSRGVVTTCTTALVEANESLTRRRRQVHSLGSCGMSWTATV